MRVLEQRDRQQELSEREAGRLRSSRDRAIMQVLLRTDLLIGELVPEKQYC